MVVGRIELRFRENAGAARTIVLNPGDSRVEVRGVTLVVRIESLVDGAIVPCGGLQSERRDGSPGVGTACANRLSCHLRNYLA
jgi:hypothetical protein